MSRMNHQCRKQNKSYEKNEARQQRAGFLDINLVKIMTYQFLALRGRGSERVNEASIAKFGYNRYGWSVVNALK